MTTVSNEIGDGAERSLSLQNQRRSVESLRGAERWYVVEKGDFQGWVCSECAWKFKPSGVLSGNTIDEMKQEYERQRDNEFASHLCREHPSAKN